MDIHGSPEVFSLNRIMIFVLDSKGKCCGTEQIEGPGLAVGEDMLNGKVGRSEDRDSPWRGKYLNNQRDMLPDNGVQPPCVPEGT